MATLDIQNFVTQIIDQIGATPEKVIPLLQEIQKNYRYLPQEALEELANQSGIPAADIIGVATFYSQFRHAPVGDHMINVCKGTACHVKGADAVYEAFRSHLGISGDEDTDAKKEFTVGGVSCLGCCTLAPVVQIDGVTFGHVTPESIPTIIDEFQSYTEDETAQKKEVVSQKDAAVIRLGMGSCCVAGGSDALWKEVEKTVDELGVSVEIKSVSCIGICHQTPLMDIITPDGVEHRYAKVAAEDVRAILMQHLKHNRFFTTLTHRLGEILGKLHGSHVHVDKEYRVAPDDDQFEAFLEKQVNIATEHCGCMEPLNLDEYCENGGFKHLKEVLHDGESKAVIDTVLASGLRGRGGAGFLSGKKWEIVAGAQSDEKIIICNGDEGDPGAFMDRMLLESYAYRVLEGMITAGFAVGASKGYLYIRAEYPLAVERIRAAIAHLEKNNLLGDNIDGSNYSLHLTVKEGAGAFVCGEETALIQSIEGKRGMPTIKPPYPAIEGLWGKPTLINNAETFALVSWIMRFGAPAFKDHGTEKSSGTKVFSLAGKIRRGGLIEVPLGITLREIVEDIGGGIADGKALKAIQIGGPSGGCIPATEADVPVDFEHLSEIGAMMGSGGLVVLDESDCMVDIARYFLSFTQNESCGKCTYCRVGTKRMLEIMERLCAGKGKPHDIDELEALSHEVKEGSICGLGKTAPNPVLSTLHYFRDEYEAHLEGRCPSGTCTDLIHFEINDSCTGCTKCVAVCPVDAIESRPYKKHTIDQELCTKCHACVDVCPENAVEVLS